METGQSSEWVFPSPDDRKSHFAHIQRPWQWIVKKAELDDFRFHDLRHTAASIAYERNRDLKGTQLFLQHSDSRTTADRYIHTTDLGPQLEASEAVVEAVFAASDSSVQGLCDSVFGDPDFSRDCEDGVA